MEKDVEKILIQQLSEAAALAPSALAVAAGIVPSTLTRHTTETVEIKSKLSLKTLGKLASYMDMQPATLVGHRDAIERAIRAGKQPPVLDRNKFVINTPQSVESGLQPMIARSMGDSPFGPDTVPVLGNANGSSEAIVLNFDEPIGEIMRHPNQKGMKNSFALYMHGESMYPRYMEGDPVYAIANRPPSRGQDCIIEMSNGDSFIKHFIKKTAKEIICQQFKPDKEWKRPLADIKAIHAVVGRG